MMVVAHFQVDSGAEVNVEQPLAAESGRRSVQQTERDGPGSGVQQTESDGPDNALQQDALQAYLTQVYRRALYSAEEEQRLIRLAVAGNQQARQQLIEAHLRLVVAIAQKYQNRGLDLADLIEEGNLGLLHALEKFDPEREVRLATYATWWIREAIEQAIKNQSRLIRLPVHIIKILSKCLRQQEHQRQHGDGKSNVEAVASALSMTVPEVNYILALNGGCVSLDAPFNTDTADAAIDMLPDDQRPAPDIAVHDANIRTCIQKWLGELNERQRFVIIHRFGLNGHDEATLQEVAQILGVSRERTHQIQMAALKVLRRTLEQASLTKSALI